jgi:hypothetical protein
MDVALDVSAVPLTEEQIKTILDAREPRDGDIAVPTSIAFGEEKRFVPISSGEVKEYATAQEMIAAEPPLPDPVFKSGDVVPCTYDAGALLDKLDHHAGEFQELIKEMFEKGPVLKLTEEGMQEEVDNFMKIKNE